MRLEFTGGGPKDGEVEETLRLVAEPEIRVPYEKGSYREREAPVHVYQLAGGKGRKALYRYVNGA